MLGGISTEMSLQPSVSNNGLPVSITITLHIYEALKYNDNDPHVMFCVFIQESTYKIRL